jgi:flagellar motility protein MotE (MotC chaperone)
MPPEEAVIDAPSGEQPSVINSPAFGNLADAFDQAFPSTVDEPTDDQLIDEPPPRPAKVPEKPAAKAPPKEEKKPAPAADEVPEAVFGEPKKEEPAPEPVAETFKGPKELRQAYDKTKAELKRLADENAKFQEQLKTPPKDETAQARIAELETQLREYSDTVASVKLEQHPAFVAKFVKPREQLIANAFGLLKTAEVDPAGLEKAMSLTGKPRIQALDDFFDNIESPTTRTRVAALVDQIDNIDEQKSAVLADAKGSYERLTTHDKAEQHRQAQEQTAKLEKVFDGAIEHLRDKVGFEVLKEVDGVDWWNKQGKSAIEAARALMFQNDNPEQMAIGSVLAATSGIHRGLWLKERSQRLALAKELAEIKNADPDLSGNSDRGGDDAEDEHLPFAQRVAKQSGLR